MKYLLLFILPCLSTIYAEGVFAKAVITITQATRHTPGSVEVELQALPASELTKLEERIVLQKMTPEAIRRKPPVYPFKERMAGQGGSVSVYFVVLTNGSVGDIYVADYTDPKLA